jgi:hypothetical protein
LTEDDSGCVGTESCAAIEMFGLGSGNTECDPPPQPARTLAAVVATRRLPKNPR